MKKALIAAPLLLLLLAACGIGGNGWTALPTDGDETCFQVEQWKSDGWTTQHTALGVFCKAKP